MNIQEILDQYGIFILFFAGVMALSLLAMIINNKRAKGASQKYLKQNPQAARVYLTSKAAITSEAVQVVSVNGDVPAYFTEKNKPGFFVLPGVHTIEVDYTYTRPGVMYKNVSKSTGVVPYEIEVEPQKSYHLGFDRKAEVFTFQELTPAEV